MVWQPLEGTAQESPLSGAWLSIKTTQRLSGTSIMGNSPSPCLKVSSAGLAFLHLGIAAGEHLAQRALTPPGPGRVSRAMLFLVRACPRRSKGKAGSFSAVSPEHCEAEPCRPPPLLTEIEQVLAIFCRLRHYLINKMLSGSVGLHLASKTGFPRVYRTAPGLWGETSPLGNKREDVACAWGPAISSPVETSDTSTAKRACRDPSTCRAVS